MVIKLSTSESETQTSDFDTCESNISVETPEFVTEPVVNEPKVVSQPKVWSDAPIIEEYESDSEDEHVSLPTEEQETPSFANKQVKTPRETVKNQFTQKMRKKSSQREIRPIWNNVQRVNHQNKFVPTAILTRTGKIPVNTARASGTNTVLLGEKGKLLLSPQQVVIGDQKDITGTKSPNTMDYPHRALQNKGIVDSGVQAHDWKTMGLTMCDKKNKVLFTDTECLVLSPEFKLPDANQILLRIPKQNNMYKFHLVNSVPSEGKGPTWLFDLDYLTDSMNYQPVSSENQANKHAGQKEANHNVGTEDIIDAGDSEKEAESAQDYFVLPIWSSYSSTVKRSTAKNAGEAPNKHPDLKSDEKPEDKEEQVFLDELERLKRQEQDAHDAAEALRKEFAKDTEDLLFQAGAAKASGTNTVNTASTPVSTASPYGGLSFTDLTNTDQDDSEIPALEEIYDNPTDGIFTNSSYDDEGAVADFTNLETIVNVSPIPTSRFNSIHPSTQILGDPKLAV
ncbi:hypothetical protein Tco_1002356 [Tanacetum coccineum]|uniref:Uncharacterized protein n=1 Tax=Tanacetum coccineum TaxID=301880 RepID=A0ABQ5F7E8_9ASTR